MSVRRCTEDAVKETFTYVPRSESIFWSLSVPSAAFRFCRPSPTAGPREAGGGVTGSTLSLATVGSRKASVSAMVESTSSRHGSRLDRYPRPRPRPFPLLRPKAAPGRVVLRGGRENEVQDEKTCRGAVVLLMSIGDVDRPWLL